MFTHPLLNLEEQVGHSTGTKVGPDKDQKTNNFLDVEDVECSQWTDISKPSCGPGGTRSNGVQKLE